jgi:predicted Zn-dependent protease
MTLKKQLLLLLLLLITLSPCVNAQKKEIAQARTYIKSGKNLDKAEQSMRKLLLDSANVRNIRIYTTLAEIVRKQYEQVNEKVYLKQPYDTAVFFNTAKKLFDTYYKLDSALINYGVKPDANERIRERNSEYLNTYRINLYNGGLYWLRKNDFKKSKAMLDSYLDCHNQPLFSSLNLAESDSIAPLAASRNLYCGYRMQNTSVVMRNKEYALKDTVMLERTLQYLAETYSLMNDTEGYVSTLTEGIEHFPRSNYFFTHLIDYYSKASDYEQALKVADNALALDSCETLYLYAKSNILLNIGKNDECIALCEKIISLNDSMPEAYYNAGVAYINKAFAMEKVRANNKKRQQIKNNYSMSLKYMEKYRAMRPEDKDRWAAALYNIYLKLNMGKEFEEIDNMLRHS